MPNILFAHQNVEAFPVGAVFISIYNTNPATLLGYGTWELISQNRMIMGCANTDQAISEGGSNSKTISVNNLPVHSHVVPEHGHSASSASAGHTHAVSTTSAGSHSHTINDGGNHTHNVKIFYNPRASYVSDSGQWVLGHIADNQGNTYDAARIDYGGIHTHSANPSGDHTHLVSISKEYDQHTVTVYNCAALNTGSTGAGTALDVTNAYTKLFIWKRTA